MPLVSVVAPVYCETECLPEFYRRTKAVCDELTPQFEHEIVLVDDGSTDRTPAILTDIASRDPHVRVVFLSRNFGHQAAITAGLDHARGDAVVVIDSDLQDPPEVIPEMLTAWEQGAEVVYGVRTVRPGDSSIKRFLAAAFYRVLQRLCETPLPLDAGDFRLLDRRVVDTIGRMREHHRYLRGMITWVGFRQQALPYKREPRHGGVPKYSWWKLARLAFHGITSFSDRPLVLSGLMGTVVAALALCWATYIAVSKALDPSLAVPGWASQIIVTMLLGGIQLISIGILGVYVGQIFTQAKERPLYIVALRRNFAADDDEFDSGAAPSHAIRDEARGPVPGFASPPQAAQASPARYSPSSTIT
jgi:dolichol-phosphate mannosyltransferase